MARQRKLKLFTITLLLVLLTGCNRGSRVKIPSYDPQRAGRQAVEAMDTNGDQLLSREELATRRIGDIGPGGDPLS